MYASSSEIKICLYCNTEFPDYTTVCSHTFHLRCLALYYHYYHCCPVCNKYISLPYVQAIDKTKCYSCSSPNQLQTLKCFHNFCVSCLINKKCKLECCKENINDAQILTIECPTCKENISIRHFSEINCPTHGSLCKKCYNLSLANNECIGACGFKFDFALVGNCFGCSNESLIYYSNNECNNNCLICIDCKAWYIINYGESNRCYICTSPIKS